ncbi:hypothetical protein GVAV_002025 [Gurleya vavrai]
MNDIKENKKLIVDQSDILLNSNKEKEGQLNISEFQNKTFNKNNTLNFKNYGNTCYSNSVIQALYTQKNFVDLINSTKCKGVLINILRKTFHTMTDEVKIKEYTTFLISNTMNIILKNSRFVNKRQEDVNEFLIAILDILSGEFKTSKNINDYTKFESLFDGKQFWFQSLDSDFFRPINLRTTVFPIKKNLSTTMTEFFTESFCNNEQNQNYIHRMLVTEKPPQCMIVYLQRNLFFGKDRSSFQIEKTVEIQETIDLDTKRPKKNGFKFNLNALVFHVGESTDSGHYISYCKRDGRWFCFDDLKEESYMLKNDIEFDIVLKIIEKDVYILFYELQK